MTYNNLNEKMNKEKKQPKKICLLASVFWPIYPGQGGRHAFVIGEILAKNGYDVTVVTTYPVDKKNKAQAAGVLLGREEIKGMKIIRVPSLLSKNPGFMNKLMFYISFMFTSLMALTVVRSADVVIGLHPPPPYLYIPGAIFSKILQAKYVIRVTDVWPDVLFEHFNWPKSNLGKQIINLFVQHVQQHADHIMAFTPKIKQRLITDGIAKDKLTTIEIAVDAELFSPNSKSKQQLSQDEHELFSNNFIVLYSGAFTLSYDFDVFLDSAKHLEHHEDIRFVLLGDGAAKQQIIQKIDELQLDNVVLIPPVSDASAVAQYINCADVCTVPMKGVVADTMTRPSKTFEYWSCGKPVISSSIGELPALIKESNAGIATKPGDHLEFAAAIQQLYMDHKVIIRMGKNARDFILNRFSYDCLELKLVDMIETV